MSNQSNDTPQYDIIIAGAGVSGLFAAWRLLNEIQPAPSILIIEKLGRTGGRLQTTTVDITGADGQTYAVKDEEGAMRFVPQDSGKMQHLWKLIGALQAEGNSLTPVDFVMGDQNNRYLLRGRSFTERDAQVSGDAIWATIYNLAPGERNKNPSAILGEVMDSILSQNGETQIPVSPAEWMTFRNEWTYADFEGNAITLNQWGFWAILRQFGLSEECVEMLDHTLGFMGPVRAFINAGEGLQILFDFPSPRQTPFKTLAEGFQTLATALTESITAKGALIYLNETVNAVRESSAGITVESDAGTYTAGRVILALPRKPLAKLSAASPLLNTNASFMAALDSVREMELTKVGLYFDQRWWHANPAVALTNGPNFTDEPLGSVYTFSQFPEDAAQDATYVGPAALTQYTDYDRGNYWQELQNLGEAYRTSAFPTNPAGTFPASKALVHEMLAQVRRLFGMPPDAEIPAPVLSTFRVWGAEPFGHGYHQYKLGVDDMDDVYFNIWNPAPEVFVCNESWSPEQGWVEGALIMSDFVAVLGFGLAPYVDDAGSFIKQLKATPEATHAHHH